MPRSVATSTAIDGANALDRSADGRTTRVDLLVLVNAAIAEAGWNTTALEAEMRKDKGYISRVLNGEKPLSVAFILELPDDVEAIFAAKYAESFGQIVVVPSHGEDAVRKLVSGLFGVLAPRLLPVKAAAMAKAGIK